jgi:Recombination endonuclease VII
MWKCGHNKTVVGVRKSGPRKGKPYSRCVVCSKNHGQARTADEKWGYNIARYGVTIEWYYQKFSEQGGRCAICKCPETMKHKGKLLRLAIDHNHTTHAARGLLCSNCNRALGLFQDSLLVLESAVNYMRGR